MPAETDEYSHIIPSSELDTELAQAHIKKYVLSTDPVLGVNIPGQ